MINRHPIQDLKPKVDKEKNFKFTNNLKELNTSWPLLSNGQEVLFLNHVLLNVVLYNRYNLQLWVAISAITTWPNEMYTSSNSIFLYYSFLFKMRLKLLILKGFVGIISHFSQVQVKYLGHCESKVIIKQNSTSMIGTCHNKKIFRSNFKRLLQEMQNEHCNRTCQPRQMKLLVPVLNESMATQRLNQA